MNYYPNVMLDIECLDTSPVNRAVIVSVGMVKFDITEQDEWSFFEEPGRTFYACLPIQTQLDARRTISASTLQWWFNQKKEVQEAVLEIEDDKFDASQQFDMLKGTLFRMQDFLMPIQKEDDTSQLLSLWGKPGHFDAPKVETLFADFGVDLPVPWYCYKCMSSYKVAAKLVGIRDPKISTPNMVDHNALDDAKEQVLELQGWYQSLRSLKG